VIHLPEEPRRRTLRLLLLAALVAAAFRLPRLDVPHEEVFDEVYHAKAALSYLRGEVPVEWVHPPTSKILISFFVWIFGYNSWSWRLAPALAGIALAPVFFLLARQVLAPPDLEARFGLTGGHIFHGELVPEQAFDLRPVPGSSSYEGPIPGLYLCGSGAWPGGCVMGAPGHNAAQEVIARFRSGTA